MLVKIDLGVICSGCIQSRNWDVACGYYPGSSSGSLLSFPYRQKAIHSSKEEIDIYNVQTKCDLLPILYSPQVRNCFTFINSWKWVKRIFRDPFQWYENEILVSIIRLLRIFYSNILYTLSCYSIEKFRSSNRDL